MKKLFFTIIISFLSLNMFAQNSQGDEFYSLQVSEKLDFLYKNMLDKHIKDFKKLEDEIKNLELKLANNTSGKLAQKNKTFRDSIITLNNLLSSKQNQINKKTTLLERANQSNNKASNSLIKLESQIKNEISLITKFEGTIDPELIRTVESKAKDNKIPTKNLSELINLNQQIIKAENILSMPINMTNVAKEYNSLETIRYLPSDWHKYKIYSLKQLLSNYCSITSDISKAFSFLDNLGLDEHISSTKDDIENKRMLVINYPFLAEELDKKISNIKYVSKITDCN
jgi:hypothetical protein